MADRQAPTSSGEKRPSKSGPDPLIGRVINDRFRVVSLIARGGMGKVYRAEQAPLGREIALKVLNPNYSGDNDPEFHKRFFLEASTCSKLTHPNTVTIFDYGRTDDDVYYIAMELLEGRTLHRTLRDDGALASGRAMHIARQVCRSLREAHSLGVIHRDLKPANIFLVVRPGDENDFVKVLDFGLVKDVGDTGEDLTQTGLFMGSPKYMSPEQIRGEKVDRRADVYALGVILYEMLTGKVPFDRPNSVNILMAHVHEPPPCIKDTNPAVDVPLGLEQIVMKSLAKNPDERFASMDELLVALKRMAADAGYSITRSADLATSGEFVAPVITGSFAPVAITGSPSGSYQALAPGAPRKKKSRATLVFGLIASALVACAIGLWILKQKSAPTTVEPITAGQTTPARTTTEPSTGASSVSTMVTLRSTPAGAMVRVGDQRYGPTPADIEWIGAEAERGRRVTFLFTLEGHRDYSVTRVVTRDRMEVAAELVPLARLPRVSPRPARARPTGQPNRPVRGYKLDPY